MQLIGLFKSPQNSLEKGGRKPTAPSEGTPENTKKCPRCGQLIPVSELWQRQNVCPCGHHYRMNVRQRLQLVADAGSFQELDGSLESTDLLGFPGYEEKLQGARLACGEKEAVLTGTMTLEGIPCAVFIMNPYFMMGSMGTVVGEKITRLFELATERDLPVIGFTASGGARMQEGILSLMQMAKTSGAARRHSDAGGLYLTVLTDPTTGGVTASFAMEGDVILAEPGATVGFAGARVIEQTIRKKLPEGFQSAEFLLEHGFIDAICPRGELKDTLAKLLRLHGKEARA